MKSTWPLIVVGAAAMLLSSISVQAREIWERDWIELRTEHFIVVSTIRERKTIELARRLENLRRLFLSPASRQSGREPIKVYLFHKPLPDIGLTHDLGGYFLPAAESSMIILRQSVYMAEWIQHEYVHSLLGNSNAPQYPSWFDEGMAELLSTTNLQGESFSIGRPPRYAMARLRNWAWLEFSELLETDDPRELHGQRRAMFYNQSWLLMHYLNWGRPDRDLRRDTLEFLYRLRAGVSADAAFAETFELDTLTLKRTLLDYANSMFYIRGALAAPFAEAEIALRQMRPDEVATGLGEISLGRGDLMAARRYFEQALSLHRNSAGAQVGIAEVRKREGYREQAVGRGASWQGGTLTE